MHKILLKFIRNERIEIIFFYNSQFFLSLSLSDFTIK